jgi:hypothetical protein
MKKLVYFLNLTAVLMVATLAPAQNICISDVSHTADTSAVLDVYSTARGFLIPRLTTNQRNNIVQPAKGLLIFQTDGTQGFYYRAIGSKFLGVVPRIYHSKPLCFFYCVDLP